MNEAIQKYLAENTVIAPHRGSGAEGYHEYKSITDGSYVGMVNLSEEDNASLFEFFIKHGITQLQNMHGNPENSASIGFSESEQKWYGWSHRAIFGFGIGSKVTQEDCGYRATDKDDFLADMVRFWTERDHEDVTGWHGTRTIR